MTDRSSEVTIGCLEAFDDVGRLGFFLFDVEVSEISLTLERSGVSYVGDLLLLVSLDRLLVDPLQRLGSIELLDRGAARSASFLSSNSCLSSRI